MVWDEELFAVLDDLEHQAGALYDAARSLELADRVRTEYAQVTLASRLMASVGAPVSLGVDGIGVVEGAIERMGEGWVHVRSAGRQQWVVVVDAIETVVGGSERAVPEVAWSPLTRLGLGSVLRRLADTGERAMLHCRDGRLHEGTPLRVGADFVELTGASGHTVLVAFTALAAVQSRD